MTQNEKQTAESPNLAELTAKVIAAYVANNTITPAELPELISNVHNSLGATVSGGGLASAEKQKPAVNPKKSVQNDFIICLEDGQKFKSLKRHIMSHYGLTPQDYREKWGLPTDYPMVAPAYAKERSRLAREMGLGRKRKSN